MDLSSNRFSFGESAFVAVAEMLGRNVGLRHLDLSDNRVARWALTALAGALSLVLNDDRLKRLTLGTQGLSDIAEQHRTALRERWGRCSREEDDLKLLGGEDN